MESNKLEDLGKLMQNKKPQLPAEVVDQIKNKAKDRSGHSPDEDSTLFRNGLYSGYISGATEYATKLHMAQRVIEKVDTKLLSAMDLLREVFQKHESGLLPDRFVYDKIKKFLYGE